jgi:type III restriction enzyme
VNRHVNSIAGRLSLRPPQRRSLEILDRVCEIAPPSKDADRAAALEAIRSEFPSVTDFEREFPSLCFALATGVGKTRLMGAFVSFLYLAHGVKNFFVLAPNLTIYNKLVAEFRERSHPKYVFKGVEGFAIDPPAIITGDDYESQASTLFDRPDDCKINVFNISKINSEVRGGKSPRIKRLSEYIGESYFEYLSRLPDLVLLMDESHRYRASAGVRAINELRPILGLELTATPFVETAKGAVPFKNVVYEYALARAMEDGFVKEPAVVTRKDFNPAGMNPEQVERIKLEDGVRLHESVKVELETYARQTDQPIVKPFVLVIARDTAHAAQLLATIRDEKFFEGRYRDRVIQVDSSKTGKEEDEMIEKLLRVEHPEEPTEIVIHVNMLKEGWDVTNLYTIVPLRAANARILIEQSIGRGLRLPYGKRTGVAPVDRLNIVAHDRFQEIIEDARRLDSPLRLQYLVLDPSELEQKTVTVVSKPVVAEKLGLGPSVTPTMTLQPAPVGPPVKPLFTNEAERKVAQVTYDVIQTLQTRPKEVPTVGALRNEEVQAKVIAAVKERVGPIQQSFPGLELDVAEVVARTTEQVVLGTIDIPRIVVVPKGEVRSGYRPFQLNVVTLRHPVPSDELWLQTLRTGEREVLALGRGGIEEQRLEDYVVGGLVDFDDVSYDDHADLLYDLATQTVNHFRTDLKYSDADIRKVLRVHQKPIAEFIHAQMMQHYWEEATGYEVVVSRGFTELKESAYTASAKDTVIDYHNPPADKGKIAQYLYAGFGRCLYRLQEFQADTERKMAVILERDSRRWFRPARGQFQIFYKCGHDQQEYQPDFVAEDDAAICMIETKAASSMGDADVLAKRDAGSQWCKHASDYSARHGGKPWKYVLVPHDSVAENMTLAGLVARYLVGP